MNCRVGPGEDTMPDESTIPARPAAGFGPGDATARRVVRLGYDTLMQGHRARTDQGAPPS